MSSPGETLTGGALNAAISNAVVGLLRESVGRGPTKARTIHSDKVVLCVFQDTMTRAEQTLAASGKEDVVLGMRHAFQETMRAELTAAIEALTGREVVAFMSANHVDPDLAAEVFVLNEPVPEAAEVFGADSLNSHEHTTTTSVSRDGWEPVTKGDEITARSGAPAQVRQDAGRWLDDGGSFSSEAVARSKLPSS
jgi:uncharacterized protein YbcI